MNLYKNIKISLKEDEDWEDLSVWKDKTVVANMPKFNAGIEKILDNLYDTGYITYFNYLEATLHFSAYAEDNEYTVPENYSALKDQLINCATENNFVIDENSFSAEVANSGEFDPELCSWDVVFKFAPINGKIEESEEGKARAEKVVSSFSSNPTKGDFYKALTEISRLENDNEIDKDEYDEYIKKIQDAYNNRPR
jgi:hypothetical protein